MLATAQPQTAVRTILQPDKIAKAVRNAADVTRNGVHLIEFTNFFNLTEYGNPGMLKACDIIQPASLLYTIQPGDGARIWYEKDEVLAQQLYMPATRDPFSLVLQVSCKRNLILTLPTQELLRKAGLIHD